jgi:putative inorganic carbon (HCO3(-)) transporter
MLHEALFLAFYLGLLPIVLFSPFTGVLLYDWLDYLPPGDVYSETLLSNYLSLTVGALTFFVWIVREKKTLPRPLPIILLMVALFLWVNVTWYYALAPAAGTFFWNRTVKVIGFAILTTQMLSTRAQLEALVWAFVLSVVYYSVPSAIKVIVSGGSGGIGTGEVVEASSGSFFGDRVILSVVMAMTIPFALYLGRQTTLLPPRWLKWVKPAMLGIVASLLISLIGTFARTAVFAGGATLVMLAVRSRRKIVATAIVAGTTLALLAFAPENWFARMSTITNYQADGSATSRLDAWKWAWAFALDHPIVGGGFGVFTLDAGSIAGRPGWNEAHNIFFQMMAEHGFVGLGLFCYLILAVWRCCAVVQNRVRGREDLAWTADLARATQIALVAFVTGGSFVTIASSPFLYLLAGITVGVRSIVERKLAAALRQTPYAPSMPPARTPLPGRLRPGRASAGLEPRPSA